MIEEIENYSTVEFYEKEIMICSFEYLSVKVDLNGERIISSLNVWRPKYEAPILAETRKNIDTKRIDRNVNIQDMGVKRLTRFQTGDLCSGYLENQYTGRYKFPGAQDAIVPRPW